MAMAVIDCCANVVLAEMPVAMLVVNFVGGEAMTFAIVLLLLLLY